LNLYAILGTVILWGASLAASAWWGMGIGRDQCEASAAREQRVAAIATEAAASAAASAISQIKVRNVTIKQPLETIVRTEKVFSECRSGEPARRLLNDTIGAAEPQQGAASGVVPAAVPAD